MITVEGMDNTGKTTLVERIAADFPQLKHNPSIGNKHNIDQIAKQALLQSGSDDYLQLWDRSRIISEYIYNPAIRARPFAFGTRSWLVLMGEFVLRPQIVIWCNRPYGDILRRFEERDQLGGVYENADKIIVAYETVMKFLSYTLYEVQGFYPVFRYDYEKVDYEQHLKPIIADYIKSEGGKHLIERKGGAVEYS